MGSCSAAVLWLHHGVCTSVGGEGEGEEGDAMLAPVRASLWMASWPAALNAFDPAPCCRRLEQICKTSPELFPASSPGGLPSSTPGQRAVDSRGSRRTSQGRRLRRRSWADSDYLAQRMQQYGRHLQVGPGTGWGQRALQFCVLLHVGI